MQAELLAQIDDMIALAFGRAAERGIAVPARLPYRAVQAFILTSGAFFGMSAEDAAGVMGVAPVTVYNHLSALKATNANIASFLALWDNADSKASLHRPLSIHEIDENSITHIF